MFVSESPTGVSVRCSSPETHALYTSNTIVIAGSRPLEEEPGLVHPLTVGRVDLFLPQTPDERDGAGQHIFNHFLFLSRHTG